MIVAIAMNLEDAITEIRRQFDGLNPSANEDLLSRFQDDVGWLPAEVVSFYRKHDGASKRLCRGGTWLPGRPMPIGELLETRVAIARLNNDLSSVGKVVMFWTDDNSNYLGFYTDGLLRGWLVCVDHEEPILTPAFRSLSSFLTSLLASALGIASEDGVAYDLPRLPRDIPAIDDNPKYLVADRELVSEFRRLYENEADDDARRLYAMCAMCLTPVSDTAQVLSFLNDPDMWTPESAVRILEIRRFKEGVEQLEKLAQDGIPNGDSAAMRQLIRMGTIRSREAVSRLKRCLKGRKLESLEMWMRHGNRLQPPRWP
jgi:hypothetical protein